MCAGILQSNYDLTFWSAVRPAGENSPPPYVDYQREEPCPYLFPKIFGQYILF